jgi:hypothetical protein
VADHEGHLLCGHIRRRYDQVAFILAGQVVKDYYEFAIFCRLHVSGMCYKQPKMMISTPDMIGMSN